MTSKSNLQKHALRIWQEQNLPGKPSGKKNRALLKVAEISATDEIVAVFAF